MPDTPDTVLELMDITLDTMVSTETESRVLPVSTPLTFPFPVLPVKGVMLRLNPRLRLNLRLMLNTTETTVNSKDVITTDTTDSTDTLPTP